MQKKNRRNAKDATDLAAGASTAVGGLLTPILTAVSSLFSFVGNVVSPSIYKRENTKNWIQQVLYSPVYLSGKSLATVKSLHATTYKKNPTLFVQYYEDYMSQRIADLEAGTHPSQQLKIKDVVTVGFVIILVVIMIIVWRK